jgi:hypothetical protein
MIELLKLVEMANEISDKIVFVLLVSVLFVASVVVAYIQQIPNPGHGADVILVSVGGYSMTLQEAADHGFLVDGGPVPTTSYTQQVPDSGHDGSEIYVSVDGDEKTLQQAILASLCGSGVYSYSLDINSGHDADEIWISVGGIEMSLQNVVNSGEFCIVCSSHSYSQCSDNDVYWYDSCGVREGKREECGANGCSGGACIVGGTWGLLAINQVVPGGAPYCQDMFGVACPTLGETANCGFLDCPTPGNICAARAICQ